MRVVFLEDVEGVAQGGDVKNVKNGFARNYLIPKQLAVPATPHALQGVERLTEDADSQRLRTLADLKTLAEELNGNQISVEMRAGASGRLYGSVTNAIIAEQLSELMDRELDRRTVELAEPIREVGVFDVHVRLHADVDADVKVVVYPMGSDPESVLSAGEDDEDGEDQDSGETDSESTAEVDTETASELDAEPGDEVESDTAAELESEPGDEVDSESTSEESAPTEEPDSEPEEDTPDSKS